VGTPNIRYANFNIPKDCRLRYSEQLLDIFKSKNYKEDFDIFPNQLFNDCFDFVKNELKTDKHPSIWVEFVDTHVEYERLEKEANQFAYQKEKSRIPTLAFALTHTLGNTIYIDYETVFGFLKRGDFDGSVFNLVSALIHEILHCFYRDSKSEQEIRDLQYVILEKFLGLSLPDEMKKAKVDYYTARD
jgi:hypothetical protein